MNDDVKKAIEETKKMEEYGMSHDACNCGHSSKTTALAITSLQSYQWLPVSDGNYPVGIYVPVLRRDYDFYEDYAYYDNQKKSWAKQMCTIDETALLDNVTHWFNLPDAPEEVKS